MSKIIPLKPVAWSYSALNSYATCPKQYHETKVLKRYQDGGDTDLWGKRVHAYFAARLHETSGTNLGGSHRRADVLEPLAIYDKVIERFAKTKGTCYVECQLAITNSFRPTGWFSGDVWSRGIADALWIDGDVARTCDWKTGRRKPDSKQLLILALLIFAHYPEVQRVNTAFVWLQTGAVDIEKYRRENVTALWQEVLPDVRRFEMAHKNQTWIPRPSGLCKSYCKVVDCAFNEAFKEHGVVV